jgi:hypothetical protein
MAKFIAVRNANAEKIALDRTDEGQRATAAAKGN